MEASWTSKFISLVAESKPVEMEIKDRFVITSDSNGTARVFDSQSCQLLHSCSVTERVTACSLRAEHTVLGLESCAELRTLQDDLAEGQLSRFTAHVTCVCVGRSGNLVAIGSADFNLKVVQLEDDCAVGERSFVGHDGPLLYVSLDPSESLLASAACDGTARVWDAGTGRQLQRWSVQAACADTALASSPCPIVWHPTADGLLALPVASKLRLHSKRNWSASIGCCSSDQLKGAVRCCSWSADGQLLAAGSSDSTICVWTVTLPTAAAESAACTAHSVIKHPALCPVQRIWWQQQEQLLCLDSKCGLRLTSLPNNCSGAKQQNKQKTVKQQQKEQPAEQDLIDAEAELDGVDAKDLVEEFETQLLEKEEAHAGADFINDASDMDEEPGSDKRDASDADQDLLEEGDDDDEEEAGSEKQDVDRDSADLAKIKSAFRGDASPVPAQLQRPMQSGSTSGSTRFLLWNRVGCVLESPAAMSGQPSVLSVEFHDSQLHHSVLLANTPGFSVAGLSHSLLALGAPSNDEVLSFVRVRPLTRGVGSVAGSGSGGSDAEWSLALPKGEDACCLAASDTFVCVGTDRRCVRLLSPHGLQLGLFSVAGPLVSVAVSDSEAAAVYHSGMPLPGDQCLSADLLHKGSAATFRLRQSACRLPLTARSTLAWLGFCHDTGALCAQDTYGVVRALMRHDHSWLPVFNCRHVVKDRTDWVWPVGVSLQLRQLSAVYCRNCSQPPTNPRPSLQFFNLQLPLCESAIQDLESQLLLSDAKSQSELHLRIFAQAVKSDEEAKALDAASCMSAKVLQLALQYAGKARRVKLAERLSEMLQQHHQLDEKEQQHQHQQKISPISPNVQPAIKRRKRELDTL